MAQTPDTDMNQGVRLAYGNRESAVLMEKMRHGQTVPKLDHEECMNLMHSVLCDKQIQRAGFRGQDLEVKVQEEEII